MHQILFALSMFLHPGCDTVPSGFTNRFVADVDKQATVMNGRLDRKTGLAIMRMQRAEQKIIKRVGRKNLQLANEMTVAAHEKYASLKALLETPKVASLRYFASLDTLVSTTSFFHAYKDELGLSAAMGDKLKKVSGNLNAMQSNLERSEQLKSFMRERQQFLTQQLKQIPVARYMKRLNKEVYYYHAQVAAYKELLSDHSKATKKALEMVAKSPVFQKYMRKNGQLASLFNIPDPDIPGSAAGLEGLQTRAQVAALIQTHLSSGGSSGQAQFSQNMQNVQATLNSAKQKFMALLPGGQSNDDLIPEDFVPNEQKTKTFMQRIDFSTNVQSQRGNGLLPTTTDFGFSVGYKLNQKSILGIGAAYKAGWGENIRKIKVTHQGFGLRTFLDLKIKHSIWMTGGYEWNYRPQLDGQTVTSPLGEIMNLKTWQQSALIGISKQVQVKSNFFKKTRLQVLWDILSYYQIPRGQPIVFRIGYGF